MEPLGQQEVPDLTEQLVQRDLMEQPEVPDLTLLVLVQPVQPVQMEPLEQQD